MKTTTQITPFLFAAGLLYFLQYGCYLFGLVLFNHWHAGVATMVIGNAVMAGYIYSVLKEPA